MDLLNIRLLSFELASYLSLFQVSGYRLFLLWLGSILKFPGGLVPVGSRGTGASLPVTDSYICTTIRPGHSVIAPEP